MAILSLASLLVQQTKQAIYAAGLAAGAALGLDVESWQPGDPTRSTYWYLAEILETLEQIVAAYAASGFLDYASGAWLVLLAKQVYNVTAIEATYAETDVTLTNTGGGVFDFEAGDVTFKNSSTDKTYHNTDGGHLGAGGTLTIAVTADEAGSESSAGAAEIDDLVTNLLGVTCTNATAAVGLDAESEDSLRQRCRDKLGALSPNGPPEAYSFVARDPDLSGTSAVTRVRTYPDSDTGDVLVYLAGPSGGVEEADRALVEAAIATWATPLAITPTIVAASDVVIPVTYHIWIYESVNQTQTEVEASIEDALGALFSVRPIGGDIIPPATTGAFYQSLIASKIRATFPDQVFRVTVAAPAGDTALANGEVPVLGVITPTVSFVADP